MIFTHWLQFITRNRNTAFWQIQWVCWCATIPVVMLSAANYNLSPISGLIIGASSRAFLGLMVTGYVPGKDRGCPRVNWRETLI